MMTKIKKAEGVIKFVSVVILYLLSHLTLGHSVEKRIIGGEPVAADQFPYMVWVGGGKICSGTLVGRRWVMTAGHCVWGRHLANIKVSVWGSDGTYYPSRPVVDAYYPSRGWKTLHRANSADHVAGWVDDIAWLLLEKPVADVTPVKLSFEHLNDAASDSDNQLLTLVGYGKTDPWNFPNRPYKTQMADTSHLYYGSGLHEILPSSSAGTNVSLGDSGGPVLFPDSSGELVQVGVHGGFTDGTRWNDPAPTTLSERLSAHKNLTARIMGLSPQEPWKWVAQSIGDYGLPFAAWVTNGAGKGSLLCRDSNKQPGELVWSQQQEKFVCQMISLENNPETPEDFEILTGSLFEYYKWQSPDSDLDRPRFTSTTVLADVLSGLDGGSGESGSGEDRYQYCRVDSDAKNRVGRVDNSSCLIYGGDRFAQYEVLVMRENKEPEATTPTPTPTPTPSSETSNTTIPSEPTTSGSHSRASSPLWLILMAALGSQLVKIL